MDKQIDNFIEDLKTLANFSYVAKDYTDALEIRKLDYYISSFAKDVSKMTSYSDDVVKKSKYLVQRFQELDTIANSSYISVRLRTVYSEIEYLAEKRFIAKGIQLNNQIKNKVKLKRDRSLVHKIKAYVKCYTIGLDEKGIRIDGEALERMGIKTLLKNFDFCTRKYKNKADVRSRRLRTLWLYIIELILLAAAAGIYWGQASGVFPAFTVYIIGACVAALVVLPSVVCIVKRSIEQFYVAQFVLLGSTALAYFGQFPAELHAFAPLISVGCLGLLVLHCLIFSCKMKFRVPIYIVQLFLLAIAVFAFFGQIFGELPAYALLVSGGALCLIALIAAIFIHFRYDMFQFFIVPFTLLLMIALVIFEYYIHMTFPESIKFTYTYFLMGMIAFISLCEARLMYESMISGGIMVAFCVIMAIAIAVHILVLFGILGMVVTYILYGIVGLFVLFVIIGMIWGNSL